MARGMAEIDKIHYARGITHLFDAYICLPPGAHEPFRSSLRSLIAGWSTHLGTPVLHDGPVRAVAFSPDGKTLLTGSLDKTARLWNAASGEPRGKIMKHFGMVKVVAFSPDGKMALTVSHGGPNNDLVRLFMRPPASHFGRCILRPGLRQSPSA